MNSKELYSYYNASTKHQHLSCDEEVVSTFIELYPKVKNMSLKDADMYLYDFLYNMFFD